MGDKSVLRISAVVFCFAVVATLLYLAYHQKLTNRYLANRARGIADEMLPQLHPSESPASPITIKQPWIEVYIGARERIFHNEDITGWHGLLNCSACSTTTFNTLIVVIDAPLDSKTYDASVTHLMPFAPSQTTSSRTILTRYRYHIWAIDPKEKKVLAYASLDDPPLEAAYDSSGPKGIYNGDILDLIERGFTAKKVARDSK